MAGLQGRGRRRRVHPACGIAVEELLKDGFGRSSACAPRGRDHRRGADRRRGREQPALRAQPGQPRPKPPDGGRDQAGVRAALERHRGVLPLRRRGRGDAFRRRLHAQQRRRRLPLHEQGLHLALASWPPSRWPPTARTRRRCTRCSRISRTTQPWRRHPRREVVEHPATWCPRGGYDMVPKYVFDGCLVAGESTGPLHEHGLPGARHGLRRGLARWRQAAVRALDAGDTSEGASPPARRRWRLLRHQDLRTSPSGRIVMEAGIACSPSTRPWRATSSTPCSAWTENPGEAADEAHDAREVKRGPNFKLPGEVRKGGEVAVSARSRRSRSTSTSTWRSTSTRWTRRAHIELVDDPRHRGVPEARARAPAALYKIDEDGKKSFDYAGCLECGTCRIACEGTIVKKWENPRPTMGVEYRFG